MKIYPLLILVLLVSLSFAANTADIATRCQKECCSQYSGTWSNNQCTGSSDAESYQQCVPICEQTANTLTGCCGGSFVLLLVPALVLMNRRSN